MQSQSSNDLGELRRKSHIVPSDSSGKDNQFPNRENDNLADASESVREYFLCADAAPCAIVLHTSASAARPHPRCALINLILKSCFFFRKIKTNLC